MPAPSPKSPTDPLPERARRILSAWTALRYSMLAVFAMQGAEGVVIVVQGEASQRLGFALFSAGWLALIGIAGYGVWQRRRWALWTVGIFSTLAIPIYLSSPFVKVEQGGTLIGSSPASVTVDLLAAAACVAFLVSLFRLRQARRAA